MYAVNICHLDWFNKKINWAVGRQKTKAEQPDTEEAGKEGRVKRSLQEMQRG